MEILIAIIGSGALFSFITFLITRADNRKKYINDIKDSIEGLSDRISKTEKDTIRTQLLVLMYHQEDPHEILRVGEYYFNALEGDWYMTTLYNKYLIDNNLSKPEWLRDED